MEPIRRQETKIGGCHLAFSPYFVKGARANWKRDYFWMQSTPKTASYNLGGWTHWYSSIQLSSMLNEVVCYNRCSQRVTFLHFQKRMPMGKRFGKYVFIMYMFTKVLYIANAVVQIFILNSILGKCLITSLHMLHTLYLSNLCIWPLAILAFL